MQLTGGTRLGPYEVLEPLGAGGMGEVWKARDTRLGREVAVKVVWDEKSADTAFRSRFEREARALSALNHPNIVCVYDVGEQDGAQYIISELVQGESLRHVISRGPIPYDQLLRFAAQISSALTAAHSTGIVHRDLKPENIMISSQGAVKILDFGLARRVREHPANTESTITQTVTTQPGIVMGTAGYMSPEQIRGEEADGRSDIFSAGVVLYEMASGARAFRGRTSIEMLSSVLKDDPPQLQAQTGGALDRVIRRCLQKDPANRYQSAAELHSAIEGLIARPVGAGRPARRIGAAAATVIAIIAGVYWMSGRKTAAPAQAPAKNVVVQQASAAPPPSPPPVAPPADSKPEPPKPTAPPPAEHAASPSADKRGAPKANDASFQQAYDHGMLLLSQRRWPDAEAQLSEAIRLRPDSALAYLGRCHAGIGQREFEKAIADCTQVIHRVPNSADAFHQRGLAYFQTDQFDKAVEDMNAAIRLGDSDLLQAHVVRGRSHSNLKEWGDAINDLTEAIRLDPQAPHPYVFRGTAYNARSQFQKAIEDFDAALKLQPNLPMAYAQRALARQRTGDLPGAAADRKQAKSLRK